MDEVTKRLIEVTRERTYSNNCDHGVSFDYEAAKDLPANEVKKRWPRLNGQCPKGCGYKGIAYASGLHYTCGDW